MQITSKHTPTLLESADPCLFQPCISVTENTVPGTGKMLQDLMWMQMVF